jgi:hypothetical protein
MPDNLQLDIDTENEMGSPALRELIPQLSNMTILMGISPRRGILPRKDLSPPPTVFVPVKRMWRHSISHCVAKRNPGTFRKGPYSKGNLCWMPGPIVHLTHELNTMSNLTHSYTGAENPKKAG